MYISAAYYLWWVPLALASITLIGFSATASNTYAIAGLFILPVGALATVIGIVLVLVELNRAKKHAKSERRKLYRHGGAAIALLLLNFPTAIFFIWMSSTLIMAPATAKSLSPNRNWVVESYYLSEQENPPNGNGVRIRPYRAFIRKKATVPVFAGHCEKNPQLSWTGENELVIECRKPRQVAIKITQAGATTIRYR